MHTIIKKGKKPKQKVQTYKMCIYRYPYINKQRPWFMTEREKEDNRTNISSQSTDVLQRAERNSSPKGAKAVSLPTDEISVAQASLTSFWLFHWQKEASKDAALSPTPPGNIFTSSHWLLGPYAPHEPRFVPFPPFKLFLFWPEHISIQKAPPQFHSTLSCFAVLEAAVDIRGTRFSLQKTTV